MADYSNAASCIELTADIVSAYVSNNTLSSGEIPGPDQPTLFGIDARHQWRGCRTSRAAPAFCSDKTLDHARISRLSGRRKEVQIAEAPLAYPVPDDAGSISREVELAG